MQPGDASSDPLETERMAIAGEIHDRILPLLFTARMKLDSIRESEPVPARQQDLQSVQSLVAAAMDAGREILSHLHPPELELLSWQECLEVFAESLPGSDTVEWSIDCKTPPPPSFAIPAYRIAQEAIRNALTHGHADRVWIRSDGGGPDWVTTIEDNGAGFDPSRSSDRFGIRTMKSRAEIAGGRLTIQSRPGGPTLIRFEACPRR